MWEETGQMNQTIEKPEQPQPQPQQEPLPSVVQVPPQEAQKRSLSPIMLVALFVFLLVVAVVAYLVLKRQTAQLPAPSERVVAPEDIAPTPDADAMPPLSESDEVMEIQKDLDATSINEEDTSYTEINTDLNSL